MSWTKVANAILSVILGYFFIFPGLFLLFLANEFVRLLISSVWKLFYLFRSTYSCKLISNGLEGIQLAMGGNWTCIFLLELESLEQNDGNDLLHHIQAILQKVLIKEEKYSKLTQCVNIKWGYPIWESLPGFNVSNHVRFCNKNETETSAGPICVNVIVETMVPYLIKNKMSLTTKDIPLWEFIIIPNVLNSESDKYQTVILFRFHHIYMDAASASLFLAETVFDWRNKMEDNISGNDDNRNSAHKLNEKFNDSPPYVLDLYKKPGALVQLLKFLSILRLPYFMAKDIRTTKETDGDPFFSRVGFSTEYFGMHRISREIPMEQIQFLRKVSIGNKKPTTTQVFLKAVLAALKLIITEKSGEGKVDQIFFGFPLVTMPYSSGKLNCKAFVSEKEFSLDDQKRDHFPTTPSPNAAYSITFFLNGLGRLPAMLQKRMLFSMGGIKLRYSISLSHVPFTTNKGRIGRYEVSSYGGWGAVYNPVGILINALRYGDGYKLYIGGNSNVLTPLELDRFTAQIPLEIEKLVEAKQRC